MSQDIIIPKGKSLYSVEKKMWKNYPGFAESLREKRKQNSSKHKALEKVKGSKEEFHKKYAKYDKPEDKDRWSMGGDKSHPFHK